MTPAEVGDAVFGVHTSVGPNIVWMPGGGTYRWEMLFDGPRPDWYVEPMCERTD